MRLLDIIMSFPAIILAAILVLSFGNSIPSVTIAIAILYVPHLSRIIYANVLSEINKNYSKAAILYGASYFRILVKHIARNCLVPVLVFTILLVADAIVFESSLSFLSAGISEPTPT